MYRTHISNITLLVAALALSALAFGCSAPDDDNGRINSGSTSGTNNASLPALDCASGMFDASEPYTTNEALLFDFEYPAGWIETDRQSRYSFELRNEEGADLGISVILSPEPTTDVDEQLSVWEEEHEVVTTVSYAKEDVNVYSPASRVTAYFLVPHDDARYVALVTFFAGADFHEERCWGERTALRDLFLDSLAPNLDTTFF